MHNGIDWLLKKMLYSYLFCIQVFLYQKEAIYKCNLAGKPAVVTRVVDSMTDNLRPTRAEATDVANAVLDGIFFMWTFCCLVASSGVLWKLIKCHLHVLSGSDAILLGAETVRGLYPVETISTVGKICAEVHFILHVSLIMNHFEKFMLWLLW